MPVPAAPNPPAQPGAENTRGKKKTPHLFPRNPATKSFLERVKKCCWWTIHVSSEMVVSQKEWASSESSDAMEKNHPHPSLVCLLTFQQPLLPREIAPGWKICQRKDQRFHSTSFPGIYWGDPSIKEGEHPNLSSVVVMKENELTWAAEGWVIPCSL